MIDTNKQYLNISTTINCKQKKCTIRKNIFKMSKAEIIDDEPSPHKHQIGDVWSYYKQYEQHVLSSTKCRKF